MRYRMQRRLATRRECASVSLVRGVRVGGRVERLEASVKNRQLGPATVEAADEVTA